MAAVVTKFLSVDPHMKNAYSSTVKFDISHRSGVADALRFGRKKGQGDEEEVTVQTKRPKDWELDVRSLISSRKWLQNYGLKKNRLQLNQILPSIGFKLSDEFDETLKRPVSSRYGGGLFRQLMRPDGKTFNISCPKDKLLQLEKRLLQAMYLFRRRLEWLTTESRRVFGVIEERAVTIVLDIRNMSPQQFDQYRTALERVIREQVSQLAKFNIIRASEDIQLYSPECAPVSHDTIENAIQWMWNLDRLAPVSNTAAAEAIIRALTDQHNEAVYVFTEGTSIDSGREILKDKVCNARNKIPIHAVSFNCDSSDTVKFLKEFAKMTGGKFHAYAVVMELDAYEAQPADGLTNRANIMLKRKTFGGIPPGAGMREDVVLVFEEMEEARNNLAQIRMLIEKAPEPNRACPGKENDLYKVVSKRDEQYMSSKEWLLTYGLEAKKLGLYDVLSGVAFKHQDGVIDIMHPPPSDTQTDAIVNQKLVNARYCERFPIVRWKDGRVVHVQVTPDVHRGYEERVQVALNKIQQRIDWLNQGSRSLFGTLVEDQMYILIDTSASMQPSLGFVKQKLFVLMQEQIRHKKKFNVITFNSKAVAWKDRLVEVSERSLQSAWSWVQNLSCWGSTNTYAAIQLAMSDPHTEAIYLLTDGRPDQPPKSIIAQVQMQKNIPVHTISFNCNDREANQFLYNLAEATGGRYHYYSDSGPPVDQPEAWESMDVQLLKDEIKRGLENLDKLADLRDECTRMAWKKETDELRESINSVRESKDRARISAVPPMDPKDIYRPETPPRPPSVPPPPRPSSAPPSRSVSQASPRMTPTPPPERPSSSQGNGLRGSGGLPKKLPKRPKSAKTGLTRKPLVAGHTRTSLMRTLNSSGRFSPNEWLLPETKSLFQLQAERQKELAQKNENQELKQKKKTKKLAKANQMSSKQWLSKHGLVAKRLTILDALGSTFVPHKAKYISILDKNVMSRVFDEVLPIAHVSKNQQVKLVNPNGVNLKEYENKLKVVLEKYRKRLNNLVWNALPESAKDKFGSEESVSLEENRQKLLLSLEEADWPIKEQDVTLLANEIARGEKFVRQSQALRKAAAGEDDDDDEDSTFQLPPAHHSSGSPRSSRSQKSDASPTRSVKTDSSPQRSARSYDSPRRSEHGSENSEELGQVTRSVDKSVEGKVKESTEVIKTKVRVRLDTLKGQNVIARRDQDGLYYPAVVVRCPDPRHAIIRYSGGEEVKVLTRNVIPVGGAVARPPLSVGDCVLIRVVYLETKDECYVPAVIKVEPQRASAASKLYTVVMYNGQKATTMRQYLVKISKERFELASMYIAEQQNEDREEVQDMVYVTPRRNKEKQSRSRPDDRKKHRRGSRSLSSVEEEIIESRSSSREKSRKSNSEPRSPKKEENTRQRSHRTRSRSNSVSGSRSNSRERSRSRSNSSKRSRSDAGERSRSRSNSGKRSRSDSRERSRSISNTRKRSRSRSGSRERSHSRSRSRSGSHSRSRSRSRSSEGSPPTNRTKSRSYSGERNSEKKPRSRSNSASDGYKSQDPQEDDGELATPKSPPTKEKLEKLQRELLKQQKKQERQRRKLKHKAKHLSKKEKRIKESILREITGEEDEGEAITVPSPDEGAGTWLVELRKSLQHLRPGEEVLARWSDDGWYYRGIVRVYHGDYSYNMEDSTGFIERIWRENIISEDDDPSKVFEIDQKVVALHPDYSFSYAPACITSVNDSEVEVEFYDEKTAMLPWSEVYHSSPEKYQMDVSYIKKKEDELLGVAVVARNDATGAYFPGSVVKKSDSQRDYLIRWADGSEVYQTAIHIFSAFTRRPNLTAGDRVLACVDPVHIKFLPGHLVGSSDDALVVKFCDGETRDDIDPALCYWLGQNYYDAAVKYFKTHDPSFY